MNYAIGALILLLVIGVVLVALGPTLKDMNQAKWNAKVRIAQERATSFRLFVWTMGVLVVVGMIFALVFGMFSAGISDRAEARRLYYQYAAPDPSRAIGPPNITVNILVLDPESQLNRGQMMALVSQAGVDPRKVTVYNGSGGSNS